MLQVQFPEGTSSSAQGTIPGEHFKFAESVARKAALAKKLLHGFRKGSQDGELALGSHLAGFKAYMEDSHPRPESLSSEEYLKRPLPYYQHTADSIAGDLDELKQVHEQLQFAFMERFSKKYLLDHLATEQVPIWMDAADNRKLEDAIEKSQESQKQLVETVADLEQQLIDIAKTIENKEKSLDLAVQGAEELITAFDKLAKQSVIPPNEIMDLEKTLSQLDKEILKATREVERLKNSQVEHSRTLKDAEEQLALVRLEHNQLLEESKRQEEAVAEAERRFGRRDPRVQQVVLWQQKKLQCLYNVAGIDEVIPSTEKAQLVVQLRTRSEGPGDAVGNDASAGSVRITWTESGVHVADARTGDLIHCGDLTRAGIDDVQAAGGASGLAESQQNLALGATELPRDCGAVRLHQIEARVHAARVRERQLSALRQKYNVQVMDGAHLLSTSGAGVSGAAWPCVAVIQVSLPGNCELLMELDEFNHILRLMFYDLQISEDQQATIMDFIQNGESDNPSFLLDIVQFAQTHCLGQEMHGS